MRADARMLPEAFLERLKTLIPSHRWDAVVNTFTTPAPTTFRVNTLKAAPEAVRAELAEAGFLLGGVSWWSAAFLLQRGTLRELQETRVYREGAIYVQGLSSMLPPLVLAPEPEETVLDLTAAPGSKTTQMACLMQGRGRLLANDSDRVRFYKLRANVQHQGAVNVEPHLGYGETLGRRQPEAFDRVLVDAPCSVEGRFQAREPKSYRFWSLRKVHEMAHKQRRLLVAGLAALRPGGTLVYSTCTFAPEENEAVVDWAMGQAPGAAVEPFTLALPNQMAGLTAWAGRPFHASLQHARRILPTDQMEGFFIAKLRKTARRGAGS